LVVNVIDVVAAVAAHDPLTTLSLPRAVPLPPVAPAVLGKAARRPSRTVAAATVLPRR
jgi:hypothetical protein